MRSQIPFVTAVAFATLAVCAAAIAKEPVIDVEKAKILLAYRALVLNPTTQQCTSDPCMVTVTANVISSDGQNLCYVTFPGTLKFVNTTAANPIKTITWSITTNGYLVEFQQNHGILVVDPGQYAQIIPDDSRTDQLTYSAINKHRKKDLVTYVPVIIYKANPGDPPSVCATGDPQIVNN
jgi:hypothetical protein